MEHVLHRDGHQVLAREGVQLCQAVGLLGEDLLEQIAHAAGVAEGDAVAVLVGDEIAHLLFRALGERVAALFALQLEDPHHFIGGVVVKVQIAVEAGLQARVGVDEALHQLVIARHDHHQIVAVVLHRLENGVDGLLAEVVFAAAVERIGFVDEQHAAQRALDHLLRLDGGLTDVAGHQAAAVHLHQLALGEDAQRVVDTRHQPRDHGLARAGIAGEDHVQGKVRVGQVVFLAALEHGGHVDEVVDLTLDLSEADVAVQLRAQILDLLGRGQLLLLFCRRIIAAGGGGGRAVLVVRLGRGGTAGCRRAPEITVHLAEVLFRHRADDLQLLQDDLVFLIHVNDLRQDDSAGYAPGCGTAARRSDR